MKFNNINYHLKLYMYVAWSNAVKTKNIPFKVARSDFWGTIPFNFKWLEHHNFQSNRKSNNTSVLEKDESFEYDTFLQDLSYHSNKMTPYPILHKTE